MFEAALWYDREQSGLGGEFIELSDPIVDEIHAIREAMSRPVFRGPILARHRRARIPHGTRALDELACSCPRQMAFVKAFDDSARPPCAREPMVVPVSCRRFDVPTSGERRGGHDVDDVVGQLRQRSERRSLVIG